jgi:hypothetical protein
MVAGPLRADPLFVDPLGDTYGTAPPVVAPQHDIVLASGIHSSVTDDVTFTVQLAGPISPPSAFAFDSIDGFIDIDADQNPATGIPPAFNNVTTFSPPPPLNLGTDFFVDLASEAFNPGFVDVFDEFFVSQGSVPITYGPNSFSVTIPFALLGGASPPFDFGVVVGSFGVEPTDRAPNGATPFTTVPEPASLAIFGLAALAGGVHLRRRKRPVA